MYLIFFCFKENAHYNKAEGLGGVAFSVGFLRVCESCATEVVILYDFILPAALVPQ